MFFWAVSVTGFKTCLSSLQAPVVSHCDDGMLARIAFKNKRNAMKNIKVLIVYQSKYGSTKQYAEWIHQEIKGDLVNIEQGDKPDLAKYDIMIFGGYMRTGYIVIAPFIKDNWTVLSKIT
jgi:hypothetical protein